MDGFFLMLGHLIGDYIVQNDWMATNKTNRHPSEPPTSPGPSPASSLYAEWKELSQSYLDRLSAWRRGNMACHAHCLFYTLAVWSCSFWWMPAWGLIACYLTHWPIDRFRLAAWWMKNISRQNQFATGPLSPWSIIIVDNIFHLMTLGGIWILAHSAAYQPA